VVLQSGQWELKNGDTGDGNQAFQLILQTSYLLGSIPAVFFSSIFFCVADKALFQVEVTAAELHLFLGMAIFLGLSPASIGTVKAEKFSLIIPGVSGCQTHSRGYFFVR
jgi:hypothetical protein